LALSTQITEVVELGATHVTVGFDFILAMVGAWTGNVRSTPTPKLIFRTVKVS